MQEASSGDRDKLMAIIARLPFFDTFSDYERKRITAFHTHVRKFKMGEYVIREGGTDASFYILISGHMSVVKAGKSLALAELRPGDFFGEVTFLTGRPRTTNVVANEPSFVIRVDAELMTNLGPEIREKIKDRIIERLVERLDNMNDTLSKVAYAAF